MNAETKQTSSLPVDWPSFKKITFLVEEDRYEIVLSHLPLDSDGYYAWNKALIEQPGFGWGYLGERPAFTAFAILEKIYKSPYVAAMLYGKFMREYLLDLPIDSCLRTVTFGDLNRYLRENYEFYNLALYVGYREDSRYENSTLCIEAFPVKRVSGWSRRTRIMRAIDFYLARCHFVEAYDESGNACSQSELQQIEKVISLAAMRKVG